MCRTYSRVLEILITVEESLVAPPDNFEPKRAARPRQPPARGARRPLSLRSACHVRSYRHSVQSLWGNYLSSGKVPLGQKSAPHSVQSLWGNYLSSGKVPLGQKSAPNRTSQASRRLGAGIVNLSGNVWALSVRVSRRTTGAGGAAVGLQRSGSGWPPPTPSRLAPPGGRTCFMHINALLCPLLVLCKNP